MAEPDQKLDYETPRPAKRPRFLEKLNPRATRYTVIRHAVIMAVIAVVGIVVSKHVIHEWHLHWAAAVGLVLLAAGVGAVCEWQEPRE